MAKNKGGRPPKYKNPEDMQIAVDKYFDENEKITICGLALALGFNSRQSLLNYEAKPAFLDIIKKAKAKVEQYYEEHLVGHNAAGSIFALKNMHWSDKQDINLAGDVKINVVSYNNDNANASA